MDNKNKRTYYANGKLLLTAEYFVLHGAKAIALPLQYGQSMEVLPGKKKGFLSWKAFMPEGLWFSCTLDLSNYEIINSSDTGKAKLLQEIFRTIQQIKPEFKPPQSLEINTHADFNYQWGLGSSSTLIANLAKWTGVNAYELNKRIFHGSGFDIACATAKGPILYQMNHPPEPIKLNYPFSEHLYFVYSGTKKNTRDEVHRFLNETTITQETTEQINQLSDQIARAETLAVFQQLMGEHEQIVASLLKIPTAKSALFRDFEGEIKSLGAWGGDFYLAATERPELFVRQYFNKKGINIIFPWKELILNE